MKDKIFDLSNTLLIEAIAERDMDLLFIEEWNCNLEFVKWFLSQIELDIGKQKILEHKAYHSITDEGLGETDIFLHIKTENNQYAVLLEDKIDAPHMSNQGGRYLLRAKNVTTYGNYCAAKTCIMAPQHYLDSDSEVSKYENKISYEKLITYFRSNNDIRSLYKANIIEMAIQQERRGYTPIKHEAVTKFWHDYWELLKKLYPNAMMKEPQNKPATSDFVDIRFDSLPKGWIIYHKMSYGRLDLQTTLTMEEAEEKISEAYQDLITVQKTGKSYSYRIEVPVLNTKENFLLQKEKVVYAIEKLKILHQFYTECLF